MRQGVVILVSPGALDGYPPVQHQARLLADAGYHVEVVTTTIAVGGRNVAFSHPGVHVHTVRRLRTPGLRPAWRVMDFVRTITRLRYRHRHQNLVEIAYDPTGVWYSDIAGFRPRRRVAHFHETIEYVDDLWLFGRLRKAIPTYQLVVTPDPLRADHVRKTLALTKTPMVVPNYPLRPQSPAAPAGSKSDRFEVIYAGALGGDQQIPFIVESIRKWPANADLVLLGKPASPLAQAFAAGAGSQRVRFEGWLPYTQMISRLSQSWLAISLLDPAKLVWQTSLGASNKRYIYMEAGLPQVGDMNPGVRDLLEGHGVGRCLSAFDPQQLASIIAGYEADRDRCRREGHNACRLILSKFNYQLGFKPLLEWLAEGAKAGVGPCAEHSAPCVRQRRGRTENES